MAQHLRPILRLPVAVAVGLTVALGGMLAAVPPAAASTAPVNPSPYASEVLADSPSVYYRLGENAGSTTVLDSSGNGVDGQLGTAASLGTAGALPNEPGTAVSGDGSGPAVTASDSALPAGGNSVTVEAWVRLPAGGSGDAPILRYGTWMTSTCPDRGFELGVEGKGTKIHFDSRCGARDWATPFSLNDGEWHLVDFVHDGVAHTDRVYLDGRDLGAQNRDQADTRRAGAGALQIGAMFDTSGADDLDEVAIYPVALTADRVQAHLAAAAQGPNPPTGLLATASGHAVEVSWTGSATDSTHPAPLSYLVSVTDDADAVQDTTVARSDACAAESCSLTLHGIATGAGQTVRVAGTGAYWEGVAATTTVDVGASGDASSYAASVLASDPSVYYRLDEGAGVRVAHDVSGHDVDGEYHAAATLETDAAVGGGSDSAVSGDGTGPVLTASDRSLPRGNDSFTVEAWVRMRQDDTGDAPILGYGKWQAWSCPSYPFELGVVDGGTRIQINDHCGDVSWSTPYSLNDGKWHLIDFVNDNSTYNETVYVDGINRGSQWHYLAIGPAGQHGLRIGDEFDHSGADDLDEVAIYPSVLTAAQIGERYRLGTASAPGVPLNLRLVPGDRSATVSFDPPADDGGMPITSYTVVAHPHGQTGTADAVRATETAVAPVVLTGLVNDRRYDVRVFASSDVGDGPAATGQVTPTIAARLSANTTSGTAPFTVQLDAGSSVAPVGATFTFHCGDSNDPVAQPSDATTATCTYDRESPDGGWNAWVSMHDPASGRDYQDTVPITVAPAPHTVDASAAFDAEAPDADVLVNDDGSLTGDTCGPDVTGVTCVTVAGVPMRLAAGVGTFRPGTHVQVFTGDNAALQSELGDNVQTRGGFAVTWTPRQTLTQPLVVTIPRKSTTSAKRHPRTAARGFADFGAFLQAAADGVASGVMKVGQTVGSLVQAAGNAISSLWNSAAQSLRRPNGSDTNSVLMCASLGQDEQGHTLCNGPYTWQQDVPTSSILALNAGSRVIASGAGNVIASGAGNVIASGGGNVIASGGGNIVVTGNAVIAAGGGNVIASGGGNVIASGAGNVIASGGGNVIASGGGNLTMTLTTDPGFAFVEPIDSTPPEATATLDPALPASGVYPYGTTVTVHLQATSPADPAIEVRNVDYQVDGAQTTAYTTAAGDATDVTVMGSGSSTVTYGAQDAALNDAAPQTLRIRIADPVPAGAPTGVSGVSSADHTSVELSWTAPTETGTPALTGYAVRVIDGGRIEDGSGAAAATTERFTSTETHQTITGLTAGHVYVFTVHGYAADSSGDVTGSSSELSDPVFTASVPDAPTDLRATASGDRVDLSWTAGADGDTPLNNYFVHRATDPAGPYTLISACPDDCPVTTSYTDATASAGSTYYYRVTAENALGESAMSEPASVTVVAATTVALTADPATALIGSDIIYTATIAPAPDGGTVAFTEADSPLDGCTAVAVATDGPRAGTAQCTTSYSEAGDHRVVAAYTGTSAFAEASSDPVTVSVTVRSSPPPAGAGQDIDFPSPMGLAYGDDDADPGATSSAGLPISYDSTTPSVCTITDDGLLHIVAAGECTVRASQAGDAAYAPATPVTRTFQIDKAALTVTAPDAEMTDGDTPPAIEPSYAGFVNGDSAADLDTPPGCAVDVDSRTTRCRGGDDHDYTFSYQDGALTIDPRGQQLTVTVAPVVSYARRWVPVSAASDAELPVTLSASPGRVCAVAGGRLRIRHAGACTVTASQAGDDSHTPAETERIVTVQPAPLTIRATDAVRLRSGGLPRVGALLTGLVRGDSIFDLDRAPRCVAVTRHPHTRCRGAVDPDYRIRYRLGRLSTSPTGYAVRSAAVLHARTGRRVRSRIIVMGGPERRLRVVVKGLHRLPEGLHLRRHGPGRGAVLVGRPTAVRSATLRVLVKKGHATVAYQTLHVEVVD